MGGSSSSSSSQSAQTQQTQSVTGGSGTNSPTVAAGGNVTYTSSDPSVANNALNVAAQAIQNALSGAGNAVSTIQNLASNQAQLAAQINSSQGQTLAQSISAQNSLAAAQGTGGASYTSTSTNYLILGAIAVALVGVFALFRKK